MHLVSHISYTGWSNGWIEGLDANANPLNTNTLSLLSIFRSFTCKYAVISGLSSNSEFLHFKDLIIKFWNFFSSPIIKFKVEFF